MYNLAHICFFDENANFDESEKLLFKSANNNFELSKNLLALLLVKKLKSITLKNVEN